MSSLGTEVPETLAEPSADAVTAPRRVLILSGQGRYDDPWHDMTATSQRVATVQIGRAHV